MSDETKYPEHDKLAAVHDQTLTLSEFYDWLTEHGYHIAKYHEHGEACYEMKCSVSNGLVNAGLHRHGPGCRLERGRTCRTSEEQLETYGVPRPDVLFGLFFDIDPKKLSAEKDAMVDEMRKRAA